MALFTADWNPLGKDVYYRKFELYAMGWQEQNLCISDFTIAAAPFGGPIAIIRDERKALKVKLGSTRLIHLFSASGHTLGNIRHEGNSIVSMGWSHTESLVCVQSDGLIYEYSLTGRILANFSMGQVPKDTSVLECKIFSTANRTGVAVLTGSYSFFLVENLSTHRIRQLAEVPGLSSPPSSWAVVAVDQATKVIVAKDNSIYVLDERSGDGCILEQPQISTAFSAVTEMAVSFDHSSIVMFLDTGCLWMGTSDLKKCLCEVDTKAKARPKQMMWCGRKAVVCHWANIMLVIGLEKDFINYTFDDAVHLAQELDGIRVISNSSHELLQKVPNIVTEVLRIGSLAPGALLMEALSEFEKKSYKADEYLRMIIDDNNLELAVYQCIDAATHQYPPMFQKKLLRAASFGKSFIPSMDPESFVNACQTLRVLNAVREHTIGLPLTYTQLEYLSMNVLLDRLILRQHYCLALRIAKFLKIPDTEGSSRILAHWACYKVGQLHLGTDDVARAIAEKLQSAPGILYSEIAKKAVDCGRHDLAVKLLDYEPRASEQVPILIELGKEDLALVKAIESGDTDLVYTVILKLKEMKSSEFDMTVRRFPVAWSLYLKLCKERDIQKLEDLYDQEDNHVGVAECKILEAYKTKRVEQRMAALQCSLTRYKDAKEEPFAAAQTEEQLRLMKYQLKMEEKFNDKFMDLSVQQTMRRLMEIKEMKLAEEMHKEFNVPDKRYWWLKITVLAEEGHWIELEKFSKSKKSPIGYEAFVDVCLKYGNKYEAQKYLPKVNKENKVKYFVKVGNLDEAAKVAFEQKDESALNFILSKCNITTSPGIKDKIANLKKQLVGKK
ncbi:vacuolar protein sorting-associated protein 16 homolog [Ornithodoros turicata]|uniref:vacuolar protein sorting-associated protein 16 homolog n=1 Tax=Ornithodoros turicata TaxID=34597 RepID=UPI003138631B